MLLFEPIDVNGMTLPNRIVLTAMVTRLSGEDGFVNGDIVDRYVRFARGEPGLIVVEATAVHASKSGPLLRINDDQFIPGHRDLVQRIRDISPSRVALQIIHFLKIARSGWRQTVDLLSRDEIHAIVDSYAAAAARTRQAGYDAVELHMAHAYTISSFLSMRNSRTDEYGGRSLETRLRLASEILLKVRQAVGSDYPVGVRFDAEECIKNGYGLAESKYIALRLAQLGADYISLSAGGKFEDAVKKQGQPLYPYTGYSGDRTMPAAQYPDGANVYLAEGIKSFLNAQGYHQPVVTTGKIPTPRLAESILQSGKADLIGMARALLADPDWPRKAHNGREDQILRCVYWNVCKSLDENFQRVTCGLWPAGALQAPRADDDRLPPTWPTDGRLRSELRLNGQVRLTWEAARDSRGVYGYEVFRATNDGPLAFLTASRTPRHTDETALAGNAYTYQVRAYDYAGNRSRPSNPVKVFVPLPFSVPDAVDLKVSGWAED